MLLQGVRDQIGTYLIKNKSSVKRSVIGCKNAYFGTCITTSDSDKSIEVKISAHKQTTIQLYGHEGS